MLLKLTALIAAIGVALTGCALRGKERKQYQATFLTLFDTVTYISGLADSQEDFSVQAQEIRQLAHGVDIDAFKPFGCAVTYPPEIRQRLVGP